MPTKSKKRQKVTNWKDTVWVLNNLSDDQLVEMDAQPFDVERYAEFLEKLVDMGLEIKVGWDDYSKCYQVTVTGSWKDFPNTGYATSSRSSEIVDCFKIIWFKLDYLSNYDLTIWHNESKRRKRG